MQTVQKTITRKEGLPAQAIALLVSLFFALGIAPGFAVQQAWAESPTITLVSQGEGACELVGIQSSSYKTPYSATYDQCVKLAPNADGKIDVSDYSYVVLIAKSGTIADASWNPELRNGSDWVTTASWMSESLQTAGAYGYLQSAPSEASDGLTLKVSMTGGSSQGGTTDSEQSYVLSFGLNSPSSSANWERAAGETVSASPSSLSYTIDGQTPAANADGKISFQLQYKAESASEWIALGEPVEVTERNPYNSDKWKAPYSISSKVPDDIQAGVYDVRLLGTWEIDEKTIEQPSSYSWKMTIGATKYQVSKTAPVNGKLFIGSASRDSLTEASEGTQIEFYVEPDSGYEVDTVSVKDADGKDVAWEIPNAGMSRWYAFTMPASNVNVTVTFKQQTAKTQEMTFVVKNAAGEPLTVGEYDIAITVTNSSGQEVYCKDVWTADQTYILNQGESYSVKIIDNKGNTYADYQESFTVSADATSTKEIVMQSAAAPEPTKTKVAAPVAAAGLVYTGSEQTGVAEGQGYTLSGDAKATNAGDYTATATLAEGYVWADESTEAKTITWSIAKKEIAVPAAVTGLVANGQEQTGVADGEGYMLSGNKAVDAGDYTAKAIADANHKFAGDKDSVEIAWSIAKASSTEPTQPGTTDGNSGNAGNTGAAAGSNAGTTGATTGGTSATAGAASGSTQLVAGTVAGASKPASSQSATSKPSVKKTTPAKNSAKVSKTKITKKLKAKSLKKKAATIALPKVKTTHGKAKWKVYAKDKKKVLTLKNGKIKVKKGAKKGTYTIKVRAYVAKTAKYKAAKTKVVTIKVRVK